MKLTVSFCTEHLSEAEGHHLPSLDNLCFLLCEIRFFILIDHIHILPFSIYLRALPSITTHLYFPSIFGPFILPSIFLVSIQFFVSFFHHEECLNYEWIFFCCSVYKICTLDLFLYIVCILYKNVVRVLLCTALCKVWELVYFVRDGRIWNSQNFSEYFFLSVLFLQYQNNLLVFFIHGYTEELNTEVLLSMFPETETCK